MRNNKTNNEETMKTKKIDNYKMDKEVYKKRRQVIDLIYDAKNYGIELPRIEVRIGKAKKGHEHVLGVGRMSKRIIWITENALNRNTDYLRHVVYHEIGHAVFGLNHREDCPLMSSELDKPVTRKQALSILKEYAQLIDQLNKQVA
tara:strand:+ start:42 stop:479 length:438 start_codon:yes stop_codon:yes gene_type:complete